MQLIKASALVGLFAAITTSTPIEKRHEKFVAYPVEHAEYSSSSVGKRFEQNQFHEFDVRGRGYLTKLKVGSNQQELKVLIDTGSANLNFPHVGAKCLGKACQAEYSFDPSESTTFKNLSKPYSVTYGIGKATGKASGFQLTDNFYFDDGKTLPNFEFTLLDSVPYRGGIFGIGTSSNDNTSYARAIKKAGFIDTAGFSLYAGPNDDGILLLGGVDKAKYEGELAIYKSTLSVPGKSLTTGNGTVMEFVSVLALDTGNPGLGLDPVIAEEILKEVKDENGKISCDIALSGNKKLTFDLGKGVIVDVLYSDVFYWNEDKTSCNTRIAHSPHPGATQSVGVPLIKHLYLTHNFETNQLGIAPVKHTDESNIVDFWF